MNCKFFSVVLILLAISGIQDGFVVDVASVAIDTINFIGSVITIYQGAEKKLTETDQIDLINKNITILSETIKNKFDKLTSQIISIETQIGNYLLTKEFERQYDELYYNIERIDFLYNETQNWSQYVKAGKPWDIEKRTKQMISLDRDYPQAVLHQLKRFFLKINKKSIPTFLNNFSNLLLSVKCDDNVTPHYQLFSLYKQLIYTEVQGFVAMAFSYMLKYKINHETYEIDEIKNARIENINDYTKLFRYKIENIRNIIRRCDINYRDNKSISGHKTYATLNNIFYTIVFNADRFNLYDEVKKKQIHNVVKLCQLQDDCTDDNHDYDKICPGWITNCQLAISIEFCQRNETTDQSSTKNYYWMKIRSLKNLQIVYSNFGNIDYQCQPFKHHLIIQSSFWLHKDNNLKTPFFCNCIDNSIHTDNDKIRAFSLLWSQTSVKMVATGARLVAKDRMIHIQLREAKLLPFGEIDKATERWVPLPVFEYSQNFPSVAINSRGKRRVLNENIDFVSIHHLYARSICLQKLDFDQEHLLAGVRFNYEYLGKGLERRFKLQAKYVGFNYQHGNITTQRKYKEQSCKSLPELILNNPDDPLKFDTHSNDSKENQFIKIGATDLIKDASQTTIPFFDLLEVAPETSVPITGIELFHKGQVDGTSGGFISLKIHPLNLITYMNPPLNHDISNITISELAT